MLILIKRNVTDNMSIIQELRTFLHSFKVTLVISLESIFFSLIFSPHSSTNLSTNLFLHLQFL